MPSVRIQSSAAYGDWRALARRLRQADPQIRRDLRRRIREAGTPALSAVKTAAHGVQMTTSPDAAGTGGSTGLRDRLDAATKLSVLASGIRIQVRESQVDKRYGKTLTAGSEGKTWRHPVFGNKNAWVAQTGSPWFYPTLRAETPAFRRAVERAMRDTLRMIEG